MKASGRNNPCPVCGHVKDADCRWNDTTILCHAGTDMRPGDTITIAGKEWAFRDHESGFSGMAARFKPHRERDINRTPTTTQELLSRQSKSHQWADVLSQFFAAADAVWNIPDFHTASPQQLTTAFTTIDEAQLKAAALAPHLQSIWRDCPNLKQQHRLRVEQCLKDIAHTAEDARRFKDLDLNITCPAAVQELIREAL